MAKQKTETTVPVFANRAPWYELVLRGKRQVKTLGFNWKYRGPILLYTSKDRTDDWGLYEYKASHRDLKSLKMADIPKGCIVGYATVVDVVPQDDFELDAKYQPFYVKDDVLYNSLGQSHVVIIENAKRFKTPVPFTPKKGCVRVFRGPANLLKRATV
jgi:hypothetical protein